MCCSKPAAASQRHGADWDVGMAELGADCLHSAGPVLVLEGSVLGLKLPNVVIDELEICAISQLITQVVAGVKSSGIWETARGDRGASSPPSCPCLAQQWGLGLCCFPSPSHLGADC